jgi:hypothetical protein
MSRLGVLVLVATIVACGTEGGVQQRFGLATAAQSGPPSFLRVGGNYLARGASGMMGDIQLTVLEIDPKSTWIKIADPRGGEVWINTTQLISIK